MGFQETPGLIGSTPHATEPYMNATIMDVAIARGRAAESGHEDVRDQAIDQAAGADVDSIPCEQPHGNARHEIDHRQHAKGGMRVDMEHGGAEDYQRQGICDEMPKSASAMAPREFRQAGQLPGPDAEVRESQSHPSSGISQSNATKKSDVSAARRKLARARAELV